MTVEHQVLTLAFTVTGIIAVVVGIFTRSLHKIYIQKAKQRKKKAGKIYILAGTLFICLGISELLFSASFMSGVPAFGWLGYGGTLITIVLSLISLSALKKYPEAEQDTGDRQK